MKNPSLSYLKKKLNLNYKESLFFTSIKNREKTENAINRLSVFYEKIKDIYGEKEAKEAFIEAAKNALK